MEELKIGDKVRFQFFDKLISGTISDIRDELYIAVFGFGVEEKVKDSVWQKLTTKIYSTISIT